MSESKAVWYLPDGAGKPAGPYTSNQILAQLSAGQMPETTLCWREGMPDWQPLTAVEPFAAEIKLAKAVAKKRSYRAAIVVSCIVCVIAAAAVAYIIMMGPPEVRRAKELMAAELYTETSKVLGPYVSRNPLNAEAVYLLAIANVNEYATAKPDRTELLKAFNDTKSLLEQAKGLFSRVFKADPKWIERAKTEVDDAAGRIPSDAPDALNRSLGISRLQAELKLADKKLLAGGLLKKLDSQGILQDRYNLHKEVILQILSWDSSLSGQIITWMLGGENVTTRQLSMAVAILQQWAGEQPASAEMLSEELLNRAKSHCDAGRNDQAKLLLSKALAIDPQAAKTEENLFLYIRVMDPSEAKLTRCQLYLRGYPDSPHRHDVCMIIVRDAVADSKRHSRWNRAGAQLYLSAGLSAAKDLISQNPNIKNLDLEVLELAKQHAESKQFNESIDLTSDLLAAVPDSAIKLQIEQAQAQWRQQTGEGKVVPGIPTVPGSITTHRTPVRFPSVSESQPVRITNIAGLTKSLAAGANQKVIWTSLSRNDINIETRKILRSWIYKGGILWVETDLAELYGFDGLRKAEPDSLSGRAEVARVQDPIVFGLSGGILQYELGPNGSVIKGTWPMISRSAMRPLLVQLPTQNDNMTVISAACDFGEGLVVLRPAKIDNLSPAGSSFELRLNSMSSNLSKYKLEPSDIDKRRRSIRIPGRRR